MNATLGEIVALLVAVGGGALWLIHSVTDPLKASIDRVNSTLDKLDQTIKEERMHREEIEKSITALKAMCENNSRRIDRLEGRGCDAAV